MLLLTRLHNFAFYDQLSTLPNRTRLIQIIDDMLQQPARRNATLSIVDIDHFFQKPTTPSGTSSATSCCWRWRHGCNRAWAND
ncbi:hypothetical protein ACFS07_22180 [Undibacterium arcticum]